MNLRRFALVALALLLACAGAVGGPTPVRLRIVHTNDLHGYVENAPAIAAIVRAARAENPNTLFLDGGDCITGTPMSTQFRGEPIFEVMSLMGYDAGCLGNHEFDHGWKQIAKFRELAKHPLLNANLADPEGKPLGDEPWHVFDVGGVRVGVLGLISEETPRMTTKANWAGCSVEPPLAVAKRLVPELRAKCDVLLLLTHVGVEVDAAIAGAVPGIDLVVGGHSHTRLEQPIVVRCGDKRVPVVQAGRYGERVGIVDFAWNAASKTVEDVKGRLVVVDPSTAADAPDVAKLVDLWKRKASETTNLDEVLGKTPVKLTREKLRGALERIYAQVLRADFGYQNLRGVRAEIAAGDIRVEDLYKVLPFENTLVKVRLKGDDVPKWARDRLGKAFDPKKEYVFATNSFVGDQQKKYFRTTDAPVEPTDLPMRGVVVDWVREHGGFGTEESAERPEDDL
jgi:2',3'-cyclic-nucleotide 2'-phosphodiesterase (5'-nucleotidase family)